MYIKLKEIAENADPVFTVVSIGGFKWKKWDNDQSQMLESDSYQEGYAQRFPLETDLGSMEISRSQLGEMHAVYSQNGVSDLIDKKFSVKTNGKIGKEIRYFFNYAK